MHLKNTTIVATYESINSIITLSAPNRREKVVIFPHTSQISRSQLPHRVHSGGRMRVYSGTQLDHHSPISFHTHLRNIAI